MSENPTNRNTKPINITTAGIEPFNNIKKESHHL